MVNHPQHVEDVGVAGAGAKEPNEALLRLGVVLPFEGLLAGLEKFPQLQIHLMDPELGGQFSPVRAVWEVFFQGGEYIEGALLFGETAIGVPEEEERLFVEAEAGVVGDDLLKSGDRREILSGAVVKAADVKM